MLVGIVLYICWQIHTALKLLQYIFHYGVISMIHIGLWSNRVISVTSFWHFRKHACSEGFCEFFVNETDLLKIIIVNRESHSALGHVS